MLNASASASAHPATPATPPTHVQAASAAEPPRSLPARLAAVHIGILPLPLYLLAAACVAVFVARGKLPSDLCIMAVVLAVCAFTLSEIGNRIPGLRKLGGPVILNTFLPSAMVFYGWMPPVMVNSITLFFKQSNFLYLFVAAVVVGSICAMERKTLLANLAKILSPLVLSSIAATLAGLLVGWMTGLELKYTLFFILVPIMAGGVGEGAVPLAIGYAAALHTGQAEMMGQLLPIVMMSNICAVIIAGLLNTVGERRPHWSGKGALLVGGDHQALAESDAGQPLLADPRSPAVAGIALLCLYALAVVLEPLINLPAPLTMLLLAVLAKLGKLVPPTMERGARWVYRFFANAGTYPLIFCVGVVLTPWKPMVAAFSPAICATVLASVVTLAATGFLLARRAAMHPIETAIICVCHAGAGGTGDVAILTAGKRLNLMATAQVATKIGGFATVTVALLTFPRFY